LTNYFALTMDPLAVGAVSALGLAHVGDGVFELLVRTWLCSHGKLTAKSLHRTTVSYVSAPAQAAAMDRLLPLLSEEEAAFYRRGRNAHAHHAVPKNATHEQYAKATGLEALFGALYLLGRRDRINELFCFLMEEDHAL
jgi:ribonuclease-3 family protein